MPNTAKYRIYAHAFDYDEAASLYAAGESLRAIGAKLGVTKTGISYALCSRGIALRPRGEKNTGSRLRMKMEANVLRDPTTGCWNWGGARMPDGRGIIASPIKSRLAPRVAWYVHYGEELSQAVFVCHTCDNPACVNPEHLFLGDAKINAEDASKKGRLNGQEKTHCQNGHKYSLSGSGRRFCRQCAVHNNREYRKRKANR